jgi:hypothetical protein
LGATAVGYNALRQNGGAYNTALGYNTLPNCTAGTCNTAIGTTALNANISGIRNTAIGMSAADRIRSGSYNVAVGDESLYVDTGWSGNVAVGAHSLHSLQGNSNISIGTWAGEDLVLGTRNILIGDTIALQLINGNYNTLIGSGISTPTTLNNNIIIADGQGNRRINVDNLGNFMINTTTPLAKNTFSGTGNFSDTLTATTMGSTDSSNRVATTAWVKQRGYLGTAFNGTLNSSLTVNGAVNAKGLRLRQQGWADYVFDSTYRLAPLKEVENFIKTHNHLPGMPSTREVTQNGVDVGETQAALLKKIEELTLYNIEQEKRIDELTKKVNMLLDNKRSNEK